VLLHYLVNDETRKSHFSLKCCKLISALPEFNQMLDFFNLFDSRLTLPYDSLNLVINALSSGLLGAWFRRNKVDSAAEDGARCKHNAPVRCLLLGLLFRKVMQKH